MGRPQLRAYLFSVNDRFQIGYVKEQGARVAKTVIAPP